MFHLTVLLFLFAGIQGWNPANFTFNPGENYELIWQDQFENVGPVKAIINGQPAYAPNPNNWAHIVIHDGGLENYTNSIQNAYVQNNQLRIVAQKDGYTSAMLESCNLQEFTFGVFAAKIRMPYGKGMWPAWWLVGHDHKYDLRWPTVGEIDIIEMYGGNNSLFRTDQYSHGTVHWNNESNTMNPCFNKYFGKPWETPDGSMLHNHSLVYWTEWTPTNVNIGVNEFTFFRVNTTSMPDSINPIVAFSGLWPFCMRLDIAISNHPFEPDATTVWPQEMIVDWIRVYQEKKNFISNKILPFYFYFFSGKNGSDGK